MCPVLNLNYKALTAKSFLDYTIFKSSEFTFKVYNIFEISLILLVTYAIIWIIKRLFYRQGNKKHVEIGQWNAIFKIIKYFIWIGAILICFDTVGIKITFLLASSAALLVGLGLGLQKIFQDIVSGFALLFEGIIKIDDIVELENNIVGRVLDIGLRTSKIETRDDIIMIIPNSKFISDIVINWSHREKNTRFNVKVGVAYGSDVEKVTSVLLECATSHKKISVSPVPFVRFNDFGDSSLDFELFFWTTDSFRVENIKSDLRYKINEQFARNGIQIPFPQRDVYIKSK